jgi:hypothetical protein
VNFQDTFKEILEERKASALTPAQRRFQAEKNSAEGNSGFQKFNRFLLVCLLLATPILTAKAFIEKLKNCEAAEKSIIVQAEK